MQCGEAAELSRNGQEGENPMLMMISFSQSVKYFIFWAYFKVLFNIQMLRKNVEKGKLGSAIVGLENKRWISITTIATIPLEWFLILLPFVIVKIRAREYIWLVEAEWPDVRERERMANYRTPSQVLFKMHDLDDEDGADDSVGDAGNDQAVRAAIEKMAEEGEVYTGVFTQVANNFINVSIVNRKDNSHSNLDAQR